MMVPINRIYALPRSQVFAPQTHIALDAYREAFYRRDPTAREADLTTRPFFEFIK